MFHELVLLVVGRPLAIVALIVGILQVRHHLNRDVSNRAHLVLLEVVWRSIHVGRTHLTVIITLLGNLVGHVVRLIVHHWILRPRQIHGERLFHMLLALIG